MTDDSDIVLRFENGFIESRRVVVPQYTDSVDRVLGQTACSLVVAIFEVFYGREGSSTSLHYNTSSRSKLIDCRFLSPQVCSSFVFVTLQNIARSRNNRSKYFSTVFWLTADVFRRLENAYTRMQCLANFICL